MLGLSRNIRKIGDLIRNCNCCEMSDICCGLGHFWPNPVAGQLPALSDFANKQLEKCKELVKPCQKGIAVDLNQFMEISEKFPIKVGH